MAAVQLVDRDVVGAAKAHFRIVYGNPWLAVFVGMIGICAVLAALPVFGTSSDPWIFVWLGIAGGAIASSYFWTVPRVARRQRRELAAARHPIEYRWTSTRFEAVGENGSTNMPWTDLWAWARYPDGYLLYPSSRMHYIVPDRAFDSDADEGVLREALSAAGIPRRRPFHRLKRHAG